MRFLMVSIFMFSLNMLVTFFAKLMLQRMNSNFCIPNFRIQTTSCLRFLKCSVVTWVVYPFELWLSRAMFCYERNFFFHRPYFILQFFAGQSVKDILALQQSNKLSSLSLDKVDMRKLFHWEHSNLGMILHKAKNS